MVITHYKWTKTVILTSIDEPWLPAAVEITKQLEASKIEVLKPAAFEPGNFKTATLTEV